MNLATVGAYAALSSYSLLFNSAPMVLYSGTQPATPETALSGNTPLAVFAFASPAFAVPSFPGTYETINANFQSGTITPVANGVASFARVSMMPDPWINSHAYTVGLVAINGGKLYVCTTAGTSASSGGPTGTATAITDGTVTWAYLGTTTSAPWAGSHAYTAGTLVSNSSNLYVCVGGGTSASTGGPTGTTAAVTDGTAHWNYVGPTTSNVLADFTVGTSGTDIILGTTTLNTSVTLTMSTFKLQLPAS